MFGSLIPLQLIYDYVILLPNSQRRPSKMKFVEREINVESDVFVGGKVDEIRKKLLI